MKEIIYLIMSLIIVNILLEIFTSGTKLYKFSKFVFSAVLVFAVFTVSINAFLNFGENIGESLQIQNSESYSKTQITNLENIISTRLELEFNSPMTVKIYFEYENSTIKYEKIVVNTFGADVLDSSIKSVVVEYLDCEVQIIS